MGKFISNYNELPIQNKRIYDLVQLKSDGNVSTFAEMIGVAQQVLDRIFKKDKRSGKYPSVSESIKDGLKARFGLDEVWLLTGKDEMLNTEIKPSSIIKNIHHSINNRVSKVINDYFNGNLSEFCEKLSLSQVLVQSVIEFNASPSYDILIAIIKAPSLDINAEWLMTGIGEPLKSSNTSSAITETPSTDRDIKILDIRVCAGHGIGFDGDENKIIGYVNIPDFTGCYGITVYGDSMYDMYMPGDTIFVREITDWKNIDNGQPHVIITNEDRLLKTIHIDYKEKTTTLSSYNDSRYPDGKRKYPDMMIDLDSDVKHIYKVVGKLARTQM